MATLRAHRRQTPGVVHAQVTPLGDRQIWPQRAELMREIQRAEWRFDRSPTELNAVVLASLRTRLCAAERQIVEKVSRVDVELDRNLRIPEAGR